MVQPYSRAISGQGSACRKTSSRQKRRSWGQGPFSSLPLGTWGKYLVLGLCSLTLSCSFPSLYAQSPRIEETVQLEFEAAGAESLVETVRKAKQAAWDSAGTHLIQHGKWEQSLDTLDLGDQLRERMEQRSQTLMSLSLRPKPNACHVNYQLALQGKLEAPLVSIEATMVLEKEQFQRQAEIWLQHREEDRSLDSLLDQLTMWQQKLARKAKQGSRGEIELKRRIQRVEMDLHSRLRAHHLRALGNKSHYYIDDEVKFLGYYLQHLLEDPQFRFEILPQRYYLIHNKDQSAFIEVDWVMQLRSENLNCFHELNRRLKDLLEQFPRRREAIRQKLKKAVGELDHIQQLELFNYSVREEEILDEIFRFYPRHLYLVLNLLDEDEVTIGVPHYLNSYVIGDKHNKKRGQKIREKMEKRRKGGLFDFDLVSLHSEFGDSGAIGFTLRRDQVQGLHSLKFDYRYQEKYRINPADVHMTRTQKRERKKAYQRANPRLGFNLPTAALRRLRTDVYQGHGWRLGLDYGPTPYQIEERRNQYQGIQIQTNPDGSTESFHQYSLGRREILRTGFHQYGIAFSRVRQGRAYRDSLVPLEKSQHGSPTDWILEFRADHLGPAPDSMWPLNFKGLLNGLWLGSFSFGGETGLLVRRALSLTYGLTAGTFWGPDFRRPGLFGRAYLGLGLNLSNWLGLRLRGNYTYSRSLDSKGWNQAAGAEILLPVQRQGQAYQTSLQGGFMVQAGIVFNFGK